MNDDDCKTLWIYLIPLNSTRKMDKMANFGFFVCFINTIFKTGGCFGLVVDCTWLNLWASPNCSSGASSSCYGSKLNALWKALVVKSPTSVTQHRGASCSSHRPQSNRDNKNSACASFTLPTMAQMARQQRESQNHSRPSDLHMCSTVFEWKRASFPTETPQRKQSTSEG